MPPRNLVRAFAFLWWALGVSLLVLSALTVQGAVRSGMHAHVLIGGVEAVSALLFLIPRTLRIGAAGLLLTIALVMLLHAGQQHFRWDLLVYAAAVVFVAVHGPVSRAQLRGAPTGAH